VHWKTGAFTGLGLAGLGTLAQRLASLGWPLVNARGQIHFDACEANKRLSAIEDLARQLVKAGADRGLFWLRWEVGSPAM